MPILQQNSNLFRDINFSDEEAIELHFKLFLAKKICQALEGRGHSISSAARAMKVLHQDVRDLKSCKVDLFSIAQLLRMALVFGDIGFYDFIYDLAPRWFKRKGT